MLGRYIDRGNPISRDPLNAGLVMWLLEIQGTVRSGRITNLCQTLEANQPQSVGIGGSGTPAPAYPAPTGGPFVSRRFNVPSGPNQFWQATSALGGASTANGHTMSAWFRAPAQTEGVLISDASASIVQCGLKLQGVVNTAIGVATGGGGFVSSGVIPTYPTTIYHCVYTTNAASGVSGTIRTYVNGVPRNTGTDAITLTGATTLTGGASSTLANRANAEIWNWQVWNRPLSSSEIARLYQEGLTGFPNTLRRWSRQTWMTGIGATDVTVAPSPLTGAFTLPAPTVTGSAVVSPDALAGTFTLLAPTVAGDANVVADVLTGEFTLPDPTVTTTSPPPPPPPFFGSMPGGGRFIPLRKNVTVEAECLTGRFGLLAPIVTTTSRHTIHPDDAWLLAELTDLPIEIF